MGTVRFEANKYVQSKGTVLSITETALEIKNEGCNFHYQVIYLYIESFGNHIMDDFTIDMCKLSYDDNVELFPYETPRFSILPEASKTDKVSVELQNRKAGEQILIPLLISYENYNGDNTGNPTFYTTNAYKEIYKPEAIRYTDHVTGEQKEIKIRDILKDDLQIDMHFVGLG